MRQFIVILYGKFLQDLPTLKYYLSYLYKSGIY